MFRKISFLICLLTLPLGTSAANEVWAKGVTRERGWFDFNKDKNDYYRDMGYCWAAAGSNILAWWQNQYVIPSDIPQGEAVWQTFRTAFNSDYGSLPAYAIEWWLTGNYPATGKHGWAQLVTPQAGTEIPSGGYYKNYFETRELSNYLKESWNATYAGMSQNLISYLNQGYGISLSLGNIGNTYNHEVTLWGIVYDGNGITKIFVTDSDDALNGPEEKELLELSCYSLAVSGGTRLGIADNFGENVFIENFDALAPADFLTPIPEPSMFGLFAGIVALALAGTRRSRRKRFF